jgi:ssDNA-binding Zn-finger/Zn-ribbon topoisomerase 1
MPNIKAEILACYQCQKCNLIWKAKPGPTNCIQCGHQWVEWLNYDEWYEQSGMKDYDKNINKRRIK